MKSKVSIQPWQMTRMRSLNFADLFKEARKKKQFTMRDYVTEIGNKYEHLVEENDTNTYNGVEFANMIAANFGIKDNRNFADCALCVQYVISVRRDENKDVRIKFKKMKEQ